MQITKANVKIKCDMAGCRNLADYCVVNSDNSRYNFNICEQCLKDLHKEFSKVLTPKSIKSIYQKGDINGQHK